jgi:hypothetical protein
MCAAKNTKLYSDLVLKNMLRHIRSFQDISDGIGQEKMFYGNCPKNKPWLTIEIFNSGHASKATSPIFISPNVKAVLAILCNSGLQHPGIQQDIEAFIHDVNSNHPNHSSFEISPVLDGNILKFVNVIAWHIAAQAYELSHMTVNIGAFMALLRQLSMFSKHGYLVINYLRHSLPAAPVAAAAANITTTTATTATAAVATAATATKSKQPGSRAKIVGAADVTADEPDYDDLIRQFVKC